MPRLIVLNGPPASGKSTLAQRYVDHHPLALNLDVDRVRAMIGQWRHDAHRSGLLARAVARAGASVHLRAGHDVVIPQLVARATFLEQLEDLARDTGVTFHEIVLLAGKDDVVRRFAERSRLARDHGPRDAQAGVEAGVEAGGGLAEVARLYDRLMAFLPSRPGARIVPVAEGRVDEAYHALLVSLTAPIWPA